VEQNCEKSSNSGKMFLKETLKGFYDGLVLSMKETIK
jgi:hypothetical protein